MPTTTLTKPLCSYHYDPLDRQVDCTPFDQVAIQRYYCNTRLTTEIQGTAQRSIVQHGDQLLAQQQKERGKMAVTLLANDQQRSILNALDAARPHPLAHTPYGHSPAENGLLSLLGFNGERPDPVTGHYHLGKGYRQFNPVLMRFNSPDSWSPFGKGGLNPYAYCGGDPINRADPTGHFTVTAMVFDGMFQSVYLKMVNKTLRKQHFQNKMNNILIAHYGNSKQLEILANSKKVSPESILYNSLPEPEGLPSFKRRTPENDVDGLDYLKQAVTHFDTLIEQRNISYKILTQADKYPDPMSKYAIANWERHLDKINRKSEKLVKHLLSFRSEGGSRNAFEIEKWADAAKNIRKTYPQMNATHQTE